MYLFSRRNSNKDVTVNYRNLGQIEIKSQHIGYSTHYVQDNSNKDVTVNYRKLGQVEIKSQHIGYSTHYVPLLLLLR